mgnify:FL=1
MTEFTITTEKFSGPLDLLLKLIEEKHLEITEINLSEITSDYLRYLESEEISPNDLADFLVIASTLLLIKSKAILPTLQLTPEENEEIFSLKDRLAIYKLFKEKSLLFRELFNQQNYFYSREPFLQNIIQFSPPSALSSDDIANAFIKILEIYQKENVSHPSKKIKVLINLKERIQQILRLLTKGKTYKFKELINQNDKIDMIVSFLAILHLAKEGVIGLEQDKNFADINVKVN